MSDVDVDGIRARADVATEGPWAADRGLIRTHDGRDVALTHVARPENAEFIAHARTDVPTLLDALAAERAKVARAESLCAAFDPTSGSGRARAFLGDLRAALAQVRAPGE